MGFYWPDFAFETPGFSNGTAVVDVDRLYTRATISIVVVRSPCFQVAMIEEHQSSQKQLYKETPTLLPLTLIIDLEGHN